MIYEDAEERYANVQNLGEEILKSAYAVLYPHSVSLGSNAKAGGVIAINTLPGVPRCEVMEVDAVHKGLHTQRGSEGKAYVLVNAEEGLGSVMAADGSNQSVQGRSSSITGF